MAATDSQGGVDADNAYPQEKIQENCGAKTGRQTAAHRRRDTHQPNNAISLL